jgi:SPW repeat
MMWARVVEVMIGCWLAISPFVFRHPPDQSAWWTNDLISGFIVVTLALLSFWTPTRHAHLALSGIAAWLIGFAYLSAAHPIPPALQNDMVVGLLLLMFVIIPDEATLPPKAWREFYKLGITGEQRR